MKCSHLRLPGVLGLLHPMVDMDMVDVASDMPREDLVAVEQLSAELGMGALDFRIFDPGGWTVRRIHPCIYSYTHAYYCIFVYRAKPVLSVLLWHHTPWSFLVFDGFQWLISSLFGAKTVWVMLVTSPMHSACTQSFLIWIVSLRTE